MKDSYPSSKLVVGSSIVVLLSFVTAIAQTTNTAPQKTSTSLAGNYEGTAKGPSGPIPLKLELKDEAGKISGRVITPRETHEIIKATMADGLLSLELEDKTSPARLTLREKDSKLIGELTVGGQTGPVEFHRVVADEISGEWDGAADTQGQAFPFTLSLKLDGENVTGTSNSELGNSRISSGIWKEGKLVLVIESGNGQIGLVATLQEGKLVGDYDFAGQMQGKWVAVRKK